MRPTKANYGRGNGSGRSVVRLTPEKVLARWITVEQLEGLPL
jgi:hypothetical protein